MGTKFKVRGEEDKVTYLKLVPSQISDKIMLIATDENGTCMSSGVLLSIKDGEIYRHPCVNAAIGLKLEKGRVVVR